jgi:ABC-type glycerol-3-phosphate transport system permease component
MDQIPGEITDAARIDGCGNMAMFFRIIWPLSMPAVAVVAILLFPAVWNEFLISRTFTTAVTRTLPVALEPVILTGGVDYWGAHWGTASAGAMLVTLPLIPIAIFFQRYLISGLMAGSVKG